jgi:hypothetical protein
MESKVIFFEIDGDRQVEKIKKQILRLFITKQDLEATTHTLAEIIKLLRQPTQVSPVVIQSMTVCAIISYSRCFNSSFSYTLSPNFFDNTTLTNRATESADEKEITERMFHNLVMNYRNKHIAHSDDFLKSGTVGARRLGNDFAIATLIASRVPQEDISFYNSLSRLTSKALGHVEARLKSAQEKLLSRLQSGQAKISNRESKLVPIPLEVDALEMWGLKETYTGGK